MADVRTLDDLQQEPAFRKLSDEDKVTFARELFPDQLNKDDLEARRQLGIKVPEIRAASTAERIGGELQNYGPFGQLASNIFQAAMDPTTAAATVGDALARATPAGKIPFVPQLAGGVAATGMELARGRGVGPAMQRGAMEFAGGTLGEGIARGAAKGSLLFRENAGKMRTLSPEAKQAIEFLQPRGVTVLPSEATDSVLLDLAHNVAEGGFLSAGRMKRFEAARRGQLQGVANDLLDEIAPRMTPQQQAALLVTETRGQGAMSKLFSNEMRAEFRAKAGHLVADVGNLRKIGQQIVDESATRKDIGSQLVALPTARRMARLGTQTPGSPATAAITDPFTGRVIQEARAAVPPGPPLLSIDELDDMRQLLGDMKRQKELGQRPPQRVQHLLQKAINEIDTLIDKTVTDPQALKLYRESNRLVSERFQTVDSDLLKKLIKVSDPHQLGRGGASGIDPVVDIVFNNADVISQVRRSIGDSPEMRQLERRFIEHQIAAVTDPSTGKLNGQQLVKNLLGARGEFADRFAAQIKRPDVRENLIKFGKAVDVIEGQQRNKIGSVAVQLTQGGVLIGALTGRAPLRTAALAFIPSTILAEMLLNPRSSRMLLKTITTRQSTRAASAAVGRLVAATNQIAAEQQAERAFGDRSKARTQSFRSQFERDRTDLAEAALVPVGP